VLRVLTTGSNAFDGESISRDLDAS
jgi:hypothetical protein